MNNPRTWLLYIIPVFVYFSNGKLAMQYNLRFNKVLTAIEARDFRLSAKAIINLRMTQNATSAIAFHAID